jgi:hypothetical protein
MKTRPMGADFFHTDGQTDTDRTKLTVTILDFASAPKTPPACQEDRTSDHLIQLQIMKHWGHGISVGTGSALHTVHQRKRGRVTDRDEKSKISRPTLRPTKPSAQMGKKSPFPHLKRPDTEAGHTPPPPPQSRN